MLKEYLAQIPDGQAKSDGIALGLRVADGVLTLRVGDGADAPDAYRPRTTPGRYVATAPVIGPMWPKVTPFVLNDMAQFRPGPPVALKSQAWADAYNEIKQFGKNSTTRTALQTETGRLWFYTGPSTFMPIAIQLSRARQLGVAENARLCALLSMATHDAIGAVLEAKYHYEFWRPVTAIRNGDIDGNPATERQADWLPIDNTPLHPEYPCAHCIVSSSMAATIKAVLGSDEIPEVALTSPFAPGVTHRFTNLTAYTDEVAKARILAGFHYRFSTIIGQEMGRKIGAQVAATAMQPVQAASAR